MKQYLGELFVFDQVDNSPLYKLRSGIYELEQLNQQRLQHGTLFFGLHSHKVQINSDYEPQWNSIQKQMLHDVYNDTIDVEKEK